MQNQGYLGIHLGRYSASVICLPSLQNTQRASGFFEVSLDEKQIEEGAAFAELTALISQACAERQLQFSTVAVALDCSLYMQHDIQSSFTDPKQISTTIHFDAEEAIAADISNVAIAYKIKSSDENGSKLSVFTAEKKTLSELIRALASNNLDPVTVEPDVNSVWAYIKNNNEFSVETIIAVLSKSNVYLSGPVGPSHEQPLTQRTFLIGQNADRSELLTQHIFLTIAQLGTEAVQQVKIFDFADSVKSEILAENIGVDVQRLELNTPQDCTDKVSYAAAAGAVLAAAQSKASLNFRNDYMPYLGKKIRLENTLKIISVSVCVILLALGVSLQLKMIKKNQPLKQLSAKFSEDYQGIMLQRKMPSKSSEAVRKLKSELRRIQDLKKGLNTGGGKSASAKLTSLLASFNAVAKEANLKIEKITITDKIISLKGSTSNRSNTLKFLKEIKKNMNVESEKLGADGGRSTFTVTIGGRK